MQTVISSNKTNKSSSSSNNKTKEAAMPSRSLTLATRQQLDAINSRIELLRALIEEKTSALESAPEGMLRAFAHGNGFQYFLRNDSSDWYGTYIKVADRPLAVQLAQKAYDSLTHQKAVKEVKLLEALRGLYMGGRAEDLFATMPRSRQAITRPIEEPLEESIGRWSAQKFDAKGFAEDAPVIMSLDGQRMRSKSETMIAACLKERGVPYLYEKPLRLAGFGTVHPDFTLFDPLTREEVFWEHMGMMDDAEYAARAAKRVIAYMKCGIFPGERLLLSFETADQPLDLSLVNETINHRFGEVFEMMKGRM